MYQVKLFNKISKVGLDRLDPAEYTCSEDFDQYDAVLVRSAKLHDTKFPENLKCIAACRRWCQQHSARPLRRGRYRRIQYPRRKRKRSEGTGCLRSDAGFA